MKALIRQLFPYAYISPLHPLFKLESPRARLLLDRRALFQMSFRVARIIFLILFVLWLLAANDDNQHLVQFHTSTSNLITLIFGLSIVVDGILDFACIVASVNSVSGEVIARRWDLLRMTPYTAEDFVAVKHTAARLRVWRMTIVVFAIRLTWLLLGVFTWMFNDGLRYFRLELSQTLVYLALVVFVLTYLMEPFWRADVLTAVGLAVSSRLRNGLSLTLAGIGSVLAFWILQPFVMGFVFWCSWSTLGQSVFYIADSSVAYFVSFLIFVYIAVVLYGFYAVVRRITLDNLLHWMSRVEA